MAIPKRGQNAPVIGDGSTPPSGPSIAELAEGAGTEHISARHEFDPHERWMDSSDTLIDDGVLDMTEGSAPMLAFDPVIISEREFANTPDGQLAYQQFMMEPVVIMVNSTTDKNAPPAVPVGCNGHMVWLPRNRKVRVRRFIVEVLARSQELGFQTKENPDRAADNAMSWHRSRGAPYQFMVLRDPHPAGPRWLERITRQGC